VVSYEPSPGGTSRLAGLSSHERHAQGVFIRRAVDERLEGMERSMTFALYGTGEVRGASQRIVSREFSRLVKRQGLGSALVARYFERTGHRHTQAQLGSQFGLSQQMVARLDGVVCDALNDCRIGAERRLEELFVRTGVAEGL